MLRKLNEYKELIGIMVFFITGFLWIDKRFPTKSDLTKEISTLNCVVEKYMMVTQYQIRAQELDKEVQLLMSQISRFEDAELSVAISPAMRMEHENNKRRLDHNLKEHMESSTEIHNILNELARNVCSKEAL